MGGRDRHSRQSDSVKKMAIALSETIQWTWVLSTSIGTDRKKIDLEKAITKKNICKALKIPEPSILQTIACSLKQKIHEEKTHVIRL